MKYKTLNNKLIDINLSKEIARGGEGIIIDLGNNLVAKIYLHKNKALNKYTFDELQKLPDSFIKPLDLLFDDKNNIIGFIMKKLDNSFQPA